MNAETYRRDARPFGNPSATRNPAVSDAPVVEEGLDKKMIAELSSTQIARMTSDELLRVVRAARMELLRRDIADHIELRDRETLERLAFLARRCCRNQGY